MSTTEHQVDPELILKTTLQDALFHWPEGCYRDFLEGLLSVSYERDASQPGWWTESSANEVRGMTLREILALPRESTGYRHAQFLVKTST